MTLNSGLSGQFGISTEAVYGTYLAPTRFLEVLDESIKLDIEQLQSQGIRAGRRTRAAMVPGKRSVKGTSNHELTAESSGALLRAMFGQVVTTGAAPYVHTFTPGDLPGSTVQVGTPGSAGVVHARSYAGMRVASWELSIVAGQFALLKVDWVGRDESTAQSLASAVYPTYTRFSFAHAAFTLAGSEVCVDNITISGDNGLDESWKVCAADAGKASVRESGWRAYTGTATADFADLSQYTRYTAATEVAFVLTLNAGTNAILAFSGNVHFTGETPNLTGAEVLKQPIPFTFVSATSDALALTAVLTNTDTTP